MERALVALAGRLGAARLGIDAAPADTLLPSAELPGPNPGDAAVLALVDRFAGHLGLDAAGLRLEWFADPGDGLDGRTSQTLGTWHVGADGAPTVSLNESLRADPARLAADGRARTLPRTAAGRRAGPSRRPGGRPGR